MNRVALATLLLLMAAAPAAPAFASPPFQIAEAERSARAEEALNEGKQRLENEDYEGAVGILQEALDDAPNDQEIAKTLETAQHKAADTYLEASLHYLGEKKYDEALNAIDSASELAPEYAKIEKAKKALPYLRRGIDYLAKKDRAKAAADFKKAYELWPDPAVKKMAEGGH